MAVSLSKGGNVSLQKASGDPGLANVTVGLGWDVNSFTGSDFDLDASCILVGADNKISSTSGGDKNFVFFNNPSSPDGSVVSKGDNKTGAGDGDDETISVALDKVPADVEKIVVVISVYEGNARKQSFGQVRNAYCRVVNAANDTEITRYDLTEDASTETSMVIAELYRNGSDWKFRAVGQGYVDGLEGVARDFGVTV